MFENVTPDQMTKYNFDWEHKKKWDDSVGDLKPISQPNISLEAKDLHHRSYCQSSYMYARTKFPPPMASREYVYARRVWNKADDGGCYTISRSCAHPSPPPAGCRAVRVEDYCSGVVIRCAWVSNQSTAGASFAELCLYVPCVLCCCGLMAIMLACQKCTDVMR